MKIAVISDTHCLDFEMVPADFFIHCGDMTNEGTLQEIARFAERLNASDYPAGVIVPGNHDGLFQHMPRVAQSLFDWRFKVLIDEPYVWKGLNVYGSPWSWRYGSYVFMLEESSLKRIYQQIPQQLDILITHQPPQGILDWQLVQHEEGHFWKRRLGSRALRAAVLAREIRHHVFGHLHDPSGEPALEYRIGQWAHNCAAAYLTLKDWECRPPRIIDIDV